jgi:[NiFe] hydrogenase large subunit
VRCVEDALGLTVPVNARVVRNLMMGAQFLHDHIVHFYHLHALDWVDLVSALSANPSTTEDMARTAYPGAPPIDYTAVQQRLQAFVTNGQLGPFAGGYWGHDAYTLDPEENLLLAGHYLEALRLQTNTARLHALFGGKNPHSQNLRVGGVTCRYDLNNTRINEFRAILAETKKFIDTVYLPDVVLLAQAYSDWSALGGSQNYLAYGEFPQSASEPASLFFPRGAILGRKAPVAVDTNAIEEHVRHSWYSGEAAHHPSTGETIPNYTGIDTADRYSWLKAPRFQGEPMEAGPLARMLVAYGKNQPQALDAINGFLKATGLGIGDLHSTLGRTAARALETQIIASKMDSWLDQIQTGEATYQSAAMPMTASGMGLNEAPRGAVGHWIDIQNQKIGNYQMVIPSTWNFGPRCASDKPGPAESALVGTPVSDPARPVEILRTIHSLDPCIACAVHVIDPYNNKDYTVRVY